MLPPLRVVLELSGFTYMKHKKQVLQVSAGVLQLGFGGIYFTPDAVSFISTLRVIIIKQMNIFQRMHDSEEWFKHTRSEGEASWDYWHLMMRHFQRNMK